VGAAARAVEIPQKGLTHIKPTPGAREQPERLAGGLGMDDFLLFVAIGFAAQLVDGALGMAYGVTAMTVLLSLGIPPAPASASVHTAEVVTTGISGLSHWGFGNVDRYLFQRLVVPGMIGGAIGAYVLTAVPGEAVRPFVSAYLLVMGALILLKAMRRPAPPREPRGLRPLGLLGGFLDAVGGGGWGPIVTSTLVGTGAAPRYAIGSVNAAEFFVTVVVAATFVVTIGVTHPRVVAGLLVGGALAAPLAAYVVRYLPTRPLMILVGTVVVLLSGRGLVQALG
jgi:uncharacterized protein